MPCIVQFDPPSIPTRHSSTTDIEMQAAHNESHFSFDEKHAAASRQQSVSVPPLSRPQPVRKYSAKWWERTWNRAVIRGRWPRVIYSSVGLGLLLIWIGVMHVLTYCCLFVILIYSTGYPLRPMKITMVCLSQPLSPSCMLSPSDMQTIQRGLIRIML